MRMVNRSITSATYTFTISQNLNHMQETYRSSGISDFDGKITKAATITFVKDNASFVTTVSTPPASHPYPRHQSLRQEQMVYPLYLPQHR